MDVLNKEINLDVLCRDTKQVSNIPLFYFYDDGTIEKRIFIE